MKKKIFLVGLISLLAIIFRFYDLTQIPPSLNWDEASLGYNAYSILKTGQDEWGQRLPLSFKAFGDYKLPVYIYFDVSFMAIFGLSPFSTRLPSALAGVGVAAFIGLIAWRLTHKFNLAIWAYFLASICPWLIILSRIALEANLALFLTCAAVYFFLASFQKRHFLILSALFLGLTLFTYNSSRVIVIPLVVSAIFSFYPRISKYKLSLVSSLAILLFFIAISLPLAFWQDSSARYKWTQIVDNGAVSKINQLRGASDAPAWLDRLIYNKATFFLPEFIKNYVSHYNPQFLFFKGGSNYQYSVPNQGLLLPVMFPLILLGFFMIIRQKKDWQIFLILWLLIAPLPAAITRDAPHALRSLFLIPPLIIIGMLGISLIQENFSQKISYLILSPFVLISGLFYYQFWQIYQGSYSQNYSWSWQYGYKEVVEFISQQPYQNIYITKKYGEPHIFILFYQQYDPSLYFNDPTLIRYQKSDWYWVDQFDKYKFINDWEIKEKTAGVKNALLITSPDNFSQGEKLKTIYYLNGDPAFDIVKLE